MCTLPPAPKAGMVGELVGDVEHVLVGACRAAVEHQDFGVLAGAELLGEHLVPVAELNHGHAVFGVFGGAQREVLLREGHGAIAGDVVIVEASEAGEVAGAPQPKAAKHHAAPNMCRAVFMPSRWAPRREHWNSLACIPPVGRMKPPTNQVHRAGAVWEEWPEGGHRPGDSNGVGRPDAV